MNLVRLAVDRPVAVLMAFAALVLIGAMSLGRLPVDLLPAVEHPRLTVVTTYADAPADDLTRLVTRPLEEVASGLAGVRRVVSRTREGTSTITVQYDWGTDMDFAALHLREAVDRVAYRDDFPAAADRPLILRWDPTARPIAVLVLEGDDPLPRMTEFAREIVKPALEQIAGVSQAEVVGGAEREILVRPDPAKLRLYGLDVEDLATALRTANVSFPGGRIRRGPLHLPLRILGEFENLEQIRRTEVPAAGPGVTVRDLAEVLDAVKEPEGATLHSGAEVVALHLYKEIGANTIDATREVDRVLGVLRSEYPDFAPAFIYRDADFVQASFAGLLQSLLYGSFLAFAVLYLFLQDWRSPIVVGLAIPIGIFTTFAFLHLVKVDLNLMSLGGLSLAAGMLVDNSIVVLEDVDRYLKDRRGRAGTRDPAARTVAELTARGTREMAAPVISATLTTVAVFFPVVYVHGIAGAFFRDQALTVTCSLLVSIPTALLLQPSFSARLLRTGEPPTGGLLKGIADGVQGVNDAYHRALQRSMHHKALFLGSLVVMIALGALAGFGLSRSFLPPRARGDFTLALELPAGTPLDGTREIAADLSRILAAMDSTATIYCQVGTTERTLAALKEYSAPNTARLRVVAAPGRGASARIDRLQTRLERELAGLEGATWTFREEGIGLHDLLSTGEPVFTLGVVGENADDALAVAEDLTRRLRDVPGLGGLEMDRVLGNPAVEVTVDRERALRQGLEPEAIARELRARVQGVVATTFDEVEQRIDVAVRLPLEQRRDLEGALATPVELGGGRTAPLGAFVSLHEMRPVREIVRRDQRRQISLGADVRGRDLDDVWREVRGRLAGVQLPAGVALVPGGEQEEITKSFRELGWAFVLSLLLVYMILAAQFESFLDPLLVASVLPVSVAGAVLTLAATGQGLNIISLIGLIALLGIAVNDAIVKISTIRRLREEGMDGHEAVLEAGRLRFRPIVMNSLTAILAVVPMAFGLGGGDQIQQPLAITIIGGLTVSTIITLFMTPMVYEIVHRRLDRDWERPAAPAGAAARPFGGEDGR